VYTDKEIHSKAILGVKFLASTRNGVWWRSEVLTAIIARLQTTGFWNVTSYTLVDHYEQFEEQGANILKVEE
jgi:hypothetical protein